MWMYTRKIREKNLNLYENENNHIFMDQND